jgi:hypothetical protein
MPLPEPLNDDLALHLKDLAVGETHRRQFSSAKSSCIYPDFVGLNERFGQVPVTKHHRLSPVIRTLKEALDSPHLLKVCCSPDRFAWQYSCMDIMGIRILVLDARFLQPVSHLKWNVPVAVLPDQISPFNVWSV